MGEGTTIAWTDFTWNPWRGCTKVGPGCHHCYAEARDKRYEGGLHWGAGAPRIRAAAGTRHAPLKWDRAVRDGKSDLRKVFALSLGDFADNEVADDWRGDMWNVIYCTPHLLYQLVTKRVGNVDGYLPAGFPGGYEHVGIIATVVNQEEVDRDVPKLLDLKAQRGVTWVGLSIEPQLGPIDIIFARDLGSYQETWLDWVIGGGESAQGGVPRPYDLAWGISLQNQCHAAGVAYFQKQLGARPILNGNPVLLKDRRAGADPSEWPSSLRVQQFPEELR